MSIIIFNACVRLILGIIAGLAIMVLYRTFVYLGYLIRKEDKATRNPMDFPAASNEDNEESQEPEKPEETEQE